MNAFLIPRRKVIEILILPVFLGVFYFFYPMIEATSLFAFGYIWNWSASNDLTQVIDAKRYRMSMLKLVVMLQNLVLKPFVNAPEWIKSLLKVLPAGIFWTLVIFINDSQMPWWVTFLGSFVFELLQLEISLFKHRKDHP